MRAADARLEAGGHRAEQVLRTWPEVPGPGGDPVRDRFVRDRPGVAVALGVHQEGQRLDRAGGRLHRDPAPEIAVAAHLPAPDRQQGLGGLRAGQPEGDPLAGASRIQGQDEAGIVDAAAEPALEQAEAPMIAVHRADPALGIGEFRLPDQGAVAEHPEAVRRGGARRQGGGEARRQFGVGHQRQGGGIVGHRHRVGTGDEVEAQGDGGVRHGATESSGAPRRKRRDLGTTRRRRLLRVSALLSGHGFQGLALRVWPSGFGDGHRLEFGQGLGAVEVAGLLVLVDDAQDPGLLLDDDLGPLGPAEGAPPHPARHAVERAPLVEEGPGGPALREPDRNQRERSEFRPAQGQGGEALVQGRGGGRKRDRRAGAAAGEGRARDARQEDAEARQGAGA